MSAQLIFVIILALMFEFLNGMRDSSNIVATMISSRAFRPQTALGMTAVAEFLAHFFSVLWWHRRLAVILSIHICLDSGCD